MLLVCRSPPGCDAKPRIQLPDHCRHAANPQPHSHWQPAKQYGQPDARHDGPVPSGAVLSGSKRSKQILQVLASKGIYVVFGLIFSFFEAGFCATTDVPAASVGVLSAGTGSSGRCWGAALLWLSSPQPAHHHEVPKNK